MTAESLSTLGSDRGELFYGTALRYAHSLWLRGFPARALLVLNRALGCELHGNETELISWPLPYAALCWILKNASPGQYIGNPRIHYQHLASRVRGPRKELRQGRAWACWWIARQCKPEFSPDYKAMVPEPSRDEVATLLKQLGIKGEDELWKKALEMGD